MTYFWRDGIDVAVTTDLYGRPMEIEWDGKRHAVAKISNRWVIDDRWWDDRTWRDYYLVATTTHRLLVLFQDMETEQWYIQRLYD